jgi:fibronectin-binding autotransporter adhesin
MADRFWRGGTAAWDGTAGAKWAATAGGATGAAVPTSADDVFFDATSSGTCTISTGNTGAKSINCTGFTGTLAGSTAITVSGSVTLVAGMTFTYTGTLTLNGTGTLTSAGKTLGPVTINGAGITVTLGDALNIGTNTFSVLRGTFTTSISSYSLTTGIFSGSSTDARTITLNNSTVNVSNDFSFFTNTNLTFNAGTSTINLSRTSGVTLQGGTSGGGIGVTFYNVVFTATAAVTHQIGAINTFNNLTVAAPASAGVTQVTFNSRQTINGTLSTTGTAGNRRVWFRSQIYGLAQTLTINSAPSLTDADFRDIYVIGTAAPISGTRIGDLRGCRGITFDTPKTVYWNLAGAQNWSANGWSDTSTGTPSTDFFPLAQDTATFTNAGSVTGTITLDAAVPYTGTVDMSGRTSAMTLGGSTAYAVYGNWVLGSGVTQSYSGALTFSGRNTQTITSAGKTLSGAITIDSYGGTVELADALSIGSNTLTVTNGTFDTKNYNVTAGSLSSNNSNVRAILLGSSTVTLSGAGSTVNITSTNLTLNAGTSTINLTSTANASLSASGLSLYNVTYTATTSNGVSSISAAGFNNLTLSAPTTAGFINYLFGANTVIAGTLTCGGATAVRRIFVQSSTLGTPLTLTVNSLSATDCDFRDITIAGTAAGASPTRAGDCGGNTGITFPAAKTVYWNLAGAQNWSATAWAPGSGGVPDINNFPLAQDTAVFDEAAGSVTGTITINAAWNIGTFDASLRTSAMTLTGTGNPLLIHGDWTFGTGVSTNAGISSITFSKRGTSIITSNGVTFDCPIILNCFTGIVELADALSLNSSRSFRIDTGTFDAVTYNVTTGQFIINGSANVVVKMGSGTWTCSATDSAWFAAGGVLYKETANIVLSNTSTTARTFFGGGFSYNKLTIGGATGTSTLTITGNNQFTELASTKTVAHTIALGTTTQTFGAWTVTGTVGNVVTLTGTGTAHILAGACTSGIDYLAMGSIGFAATSPGEFYAGANSTGTAAAPVYRTAKPADSTRYWVGGTGNWSDTARWSDSSGGASGFSVPRSHDDVVFDALSNATAYTATVNAVTGGIRTKALTIAGPLVGNLTLAGNQTLICHDDVTLPAVGLTRTFGGPLVLSGTGAGKVLTTNGVSLSSATTINGVGAEWVLGSALDIGNSAFDATNGLFDCDTYNLTATSITSNNNNSRTIDFGSGTTTLAGASPINFGTTETNAANLTVTAGTSQINCSANSPTFSGNGKTFYNVSFTSTSAGTQTLNGANTFNNLSFTGITSAGLKNVSLTADQTINGTLTLSAGTDATMRTFVRSDTIGTTRTLTCAAFSGTDADFRDITIAGAAAPVSGTRLGDCKGNSGITFDAGVTRYWNLAGGGNWSATGWAASSGASPAVNNFPLAQDTCIFEAGSPNSGSTVTINAAYNIGTIDMSARTSNTMTLSASADYNVYGNWINGTGTTLTNPTGVTFCGRTTQTITSAGRNYIGGLTVNTPSGSVVLQDALTLPSTNLTITQGAFSAESYNVTITAGLVSASGTGVRSINIGSGTWTLAGSGTAWNAATSTNLTVTGTGTISLTSASAKTFAGGGISYSGITLNQGGAGTLTISGNNTFANITNSYSATGATTIAMGTTTQRVGNFTASGEAGRVLTVQGTSASSPATLVFTGSGQATAPTTDYLTITGVRAYSLTDTWYAGANSTNNGSLGWIFAAGVVAAGYLGNFFAFF